MYGLHWFGAWRTLFLGAKKDLWSQYMFLSFSIYANTDSSTHSRRPKRQNVNYHTILLLSLSYALLARLYYHVLCLIQIALDKIVRVTRYESHVRNGAAASWPANVDLPDAAPWNVGLRSASDRWLVRHAYIGSNCYTTIDHQTGQYFLEFLH